VSRVPVLCRGEYFDGMITQLLTILTRDGSIAVPGYMKPEGIVLFHRTTGTLTKVTIGDDDGRKQIKPRGPQDLPPEKD
jgi:hypothetical protein